MTRKLSFTSCYFVHLFCPRGSTFKGSRPLMIVLPLLSWQSFPYQIFLACVLDPTILSPKHNCRISNDFHCFTLLDRSLIDWYTLQWNQHHFTTFYLWVSWQNTSFVVPHITNESQTKNLLDNHKQHNVWPFRNAARSHSGWLPQVRAKPDEKLCTPSTLARLS